MDPKLPSFLRQSGCRRDGDVMERDASPSLPPLVSSSPSSIPLMATAPSFRFIGVPNAPPRKGSTASIKQPVQRRFVRQPLPSSSSSATTLHATLPALRTTPPAPPLVPIIVTPPTTPTAQPRSPDYMKGPHRDSIDGSSCSAFSLYSAESTTHDLPQPPPPPLERVTLFRSISPAVSATDRPGAGKTAPQQAGAAASMQSAVSATATFSANTAAESHSGAGDASALMAGVPSPVMNPFRRKKSNLTAEAASVAEMGGERRMPAIPRSASTTAPPGAPSGSISESGCGPKALTTTATNNNNSTAARTASTKTAHIVSNALLDLSFDSRAFAASDTKRGSEIRRLGIRLQELQHEHSLVKSTSPARLTPPNRRAGGAHADTTELLEGFGDCFSRAATAVDRASESTAQGTSSPTETGLARKHLYAETVKFVHLIREMQDARSAARTGYTWFRWGTLPPIIASASGDLDAPSSLVSGGVPLSAPPSTQQSASREGITTASAAVTEAQLRSSLTRRDRKKARVQWNPYELRESDPSLTSPAASVCFCGYQAGSVPDDGAGAVPAAVRSPVLDMGGIVTARGGPFMESNVTLPSALGEPETPPLPATSQPLGHHSLNNVSTVRENVKPFNDSDGMHSSSAGPTRTASGSTSNNSFSFCPVHVAHRPTSILVRSTLNRSHNPFATSPTRQPQATQERGQVDVPSSAPARGPNKPAVPSSVAPNARRPVGGVLLSGSSSRHAIISVGVPHRRQLAKRALEDNKLFFELRSKQKTMA